MLPQVLVMLINNIGLYKPVNDGGTIKVDGKDTGLSQLSYDLDYSNNISPYLGLGYSPRINQNWGVFGEVGAYYTGNPTVSNVKYQGGRLMLMLALVAEAHQ